MNSFQFFAKLFALALVVVLSSCSSDQVDPAGSGSMQRDTPVLAGQAENQPDVALECSDRVVYPLVDGGGGSNVNYHGTSGGSASNPVDWGIATLVNTDQELVVEIDLASGWYVEHTEIFTGMESEIVIQNGIPQVGETWLVADVNPLVNATQLRVGLPLSPGECFNPVIGLSVVQYDYALGIDENSRTQLWLKNPSWDNPSEPDLNTVNFAIAKWCIASCGI